MAWAYDDDIDIDYHVRRSALPSPGRVRDLLELTSRLHTSLLDRHRPLWELHVVEGLNDGRFAMYTKMHHALIDGVSAMKLAQRTLSADPTTPRCAPSGTCLRAHVRARHRTARHCWMRCSRWRDPLSDLHRRR